MIIKDLSLQDKEKIKNICQNIPSYLKEYLKVSKLSTLDEARSKTSKVFLEYQRSNKSLDEFYSSDNGYLEELALYSVNPGRIQSVIKRLRVLKHYNVKFVADYGSGIGVDGLVYRVVGGITPINVEFTNPCTKFARWLYQQFELDRGTDYLIIEPNIFWSHVKEHPFPAIQAIEVVAHVEDPYDMFFSLMKSTNLLIWTNDIGHHDNDMGTPQHLNHSLSKVLKSIEKAGGKKVKLDKMAIPPRVYIR